MSTGPLSNTAQSGSLAAQMREQRKSHGLGFRSFWRMVRMVRPHRGTLILGMVLSLGVALTYAATLVGLLPVLRVLINPEGESFRAYLTRQADKLADLGGVSGWLAGPAAWAAGFFPSGVTPQDKLQTLLILMGVLVGLNVLGNVFRFLSQYLILYACNRTLMDVRRYMYRKALRMPVGRLQGDVSAMISQFLSDVREVYLGMTTLFGKVAREPLKAICVLAAAIWLDWRLTLVLIAIGPPAVGLLWLFGRKVRKATIRLLQGYGQMLVGLEESLQGLDTVKGYVQESYERKRMWQLERRMFKHQTRLALIEALSSPLIEVIGVAFAAGGVIWLAWRTFSGEIEPEHFITMVVLLSAMLDPIRKVANVYNTVQRAGAASDRIYETLDFPEESSPPNAKPFPTDGPPAVSLQNVTFRYRPDAPPALDDVSLDVQPGECIALVGPNGSGKSTLVRLLPRLLVPEAGKVCVGGATTDEISLRELRKHIAVVSQHAVVFARSARENISYGQPKASIEQVRQAARHGHAAEFIEAWPEQYDTVLGEGGATISGGQRQRIAIARAFLKPARLVIFDEATSQIDAESEHKIHEALHDLREGRTTFLIAHRHTVMDMADRIAVMDGGRIVDIGTRAELLERCPLFMALYRSPTGSGD